MNYHEQLRSIIQAMEVQDNETLQQAQKAYLYLITELRENFYFIHLDLLAAAKEQECIKILILLGRFFTILYHEDIKVSENSIPEIQTSLFSLFQIESIQNQHFNHISNIIYKASRYFENNWPDLPVFLFQLFQNQNPYIALNSIQCMSDCINDNHIDIGPFYENLVIFIQNSLSEPNESITITIISILRLFYSIVDYIDQEEQEEIFKPIINLIPNYLQIHQNDSTMINDLFLFARYHQNLFSESFHNFFENLMNIINSNDLQSEIINTAIYCLFSIIPNYSKYYQNQCCFLFDFFCSKLNDNKTYDAAIYSIIVLSELYGSIEKYGRHIYTFFESNVPNPVAYISFSISYKRIKGIKIENLNDLLNFFAQGFTSEENKIRKKALKSFWPLIEIFYQSNNDFNFEELTILLIKIIQSEVDANVLAVEIKVLSKILKFYSLQLQQNIQEIAKMLDYLIINFQNRKVIVNTIKCYRYILETFKDAKFQTLSQFYEKIITETTTIDGMNDFFFNCIKYLPCFVNSLPEENFNGMMEKLYHILFAVFDQNKAKIQNGEKEEECLLINEKPLIIKFFLRCIENNIIFNSPEILEKIKIINFDIFEDNPKLEIIPDNIDLDLTECCIIIPVPAENKNIAISYEQMAMYQNSLKTIILIFKKYNDQIQFNFEALFNLSINFLKSILKTNFSFQIFELVEIIIPFIQNEDQLENLVEKTLDKEIVHEYDHSELKKLSNLMLGFVKLTVEKWKNKVEIIERIAEFALHVLACLEIENEDKKEEGLIVDEIDDQNLFNVKIQYALILRESFRYYQQFSVGFFDELTFNIINEIQMNNDSNKVIAAIVFSDYMHFCHDEKYWSMFFELFTSYFEGQNLNVKLGAIYGLSIITNPNYMDTDSLNRLIDMFIQNLKNDFNTETCSMVAFALLQIFQNYASTFDISIYFQQFWELTNGESFEIPDYCSEYMVQSLLFLDSKMSNLMPDEKVQELCIIIQKPLNRSNDVSLDEELKQILMKLTTKKDIES